MKPASKAITSPRKRINWKKCAGLKFGRWTVIRLIETLPSLSHIVLCECECGTRKSVMSNYLSLGDSRSCGCLRNEKTIERSTRHGMANRGKVTNHYTLYHDILRRCRRHPRYAGRGIIMCDRWLHGENGKTGLELFAEDMGPRPEGMTVERKNNDGPYSPENCVWGSRFDQSNNRQDTRWITYKGETMSISRWAIRLGVSRGALSNRYNRGWSDEKIIETPVTSPKKKEEFWS